jgi:hypothetical protein
MKQEDVVRSRDETNYARELTQEERETLEQGLRSVSAFTGYFSQTGDITQHSGGKRRKP